MLHERVSLKRPGQIVALAVFAGLVLSIPMCSVLRYSEKPAAEVQRAPTVQVQEPKWVTELRAAQPAKAAPEVKARAAVPAKEAPEKDTLTAADVARIDKAVEAEHRQWEIDNRAILEADEAEIRAADEFMARMRAPMPEPTQEELAAAQQAALERALARGLQEEYEDITR